MSLVIRARVGYEFLCFYGIINTAAWMDERDNALTTIQWYLYLSGHLKASHWDNNEVQQRSHQSSMMSTVEWDGDDDSQTCFQVFHHHPVQGCWTKQTWVQAAGQVLPNNLASLLQWSSALRHANLLQMHFQLPTSSSSPQDHPMPSWCSQVCNTDVERGQEWRLVSHRTWCSICRSSRVPCESHLDRVKTSVTWVWLPMHFGVPQQLGLHARELGQCWRKSDVVVNWHRQ